MDIELLLQAVSTAGDDPEQIRQVRKLAVALAVSGRLGAPNSSGSSGLVGIVAEDLPKGFQDSANFVRLGTIARIEKGKTGIKQAIPGGFPMVVTGEERITCEHFDFEGPAAIVPLVSSAGHGKASLNRLHYQEGQFALGTILAAIFPNDPKLISARFIFEYLTAFKDELLVSRMIGTANVSLSIGKVAEVPVPLVSPDAQEKVDELMALCDQLEAARVKREATRDRLATASLARLNTPDPESFPTDARFALDALPSLTTRPDQIKQLRQSILNLAIRGRLETPDGSEVERRGDCTGPYRLPPGWAWQSTRDLCVEVVDCPHSTAKFEPTGVACIDTNSFKGGRILSSRLRFVSEETYANRIARLEPRAGDVVFAREGSVGESVIIPEGLRCCLGQRVMLFRPGPRVAPEYFQLAISEPSAIERLVSLHKGIGAKHVNVKDMRDALLPVPPIKEQNRIVAKVDELMALCDQLEASLTTTDATRRRLLDALLHEALSPEQNIAA